MSYIPSCPNSLNKTYRVELSTCQRKWFYEPNLQDCIIKVEDSIKRLKISENIDYPISYIIYDDNDQAASYGDV